MNPADTTDVLAEFPLATAADAERAVAAAATAFPAWRATPGPERGRVLWRAADLARARSEEIARTMTREEGKILNEARGEVAKGVALLEYYAGAGFRIGGKTLPSESRDTFTYTLRQPLGPVGLIAPWNFPWAIPVWKAAPALVAGNTVVLKPATLTPATALLVEILAEAGLPPGVLNVVVGSGATWARRSSPRPSCARLLHRLERRRPGALRQGGGARHQGHLRDGRQERGGRAARRRSRPGGGRRSTAARSARPASAAPRPRA